MENVLVTTNFKDDHPALPLLLANDYMRDAVAIYMNLPNTRQPRLDRVGDHDALIFPDLEMIITVCGHFRYHVEIEGGAHFHECSGRFVIEAVRSMCRELAR